MNLNNYIQILHKIWFWKQSSSTNNNLGQKHSYFEHTNYYCERINYMDQLINTLHTVYDSVTPFITTDNIALFSVIVTIIIFISNRHSELKYKKHEDKKNEYKKLIELLNITYSEPGKLRSGKNGKPSAEMQKQFFDTGASLMLYASKKLYKKYIFFRDFTCNEALTKSKYYEEELIIYVIADLLKQIRKEVGLAYLNSISSNEALAFFVNNIGTNSIEKNKARKMNYKIRMMKIELFFMDRVNGVFLNTLYYNVSKPAIEIVRCFIRFLIIAPFYKLCKKGQKSN